MKYQRREVPYSITDHIQRVLLIIVRLFLVVAVVWGAMVGNGEMAGLSALLIATTYIPHILFERRYGVGLPIEFHVVITLFLFGSIFLGTVIDGYQHIWWWDLAMHTVSGVVLGFFGFILLYTLYAQKRLDMSFKFIAMFAFCVGLAAGALWEIAEFTSDTFLGTRAQRGGNLDTMRDLVVDAVGSLAVAIAGYFYMRKPGTGPLTRFIANFRHYNPHLFPESKQSK